MRVCTLVLGLLLSLPTLAAPLHILIAEDVYQNYLKLVDERDISEIDNYHGPGSRRSSVEALLLVQALTLGGTDDWQLIPFPARDYARIKLGQSPTKVHLLAASKWLSEIARRDDRQQLLISSPIVRRGEYQVGIYTRPDHPGLNNPNDLSGLSAVTSKLWPQDVATLEQLNVERILFSNNYQLMVKMVYAGRVDLILSSFKNNADMSLRQGDIRLMPLAGIKVAIDDSRHWLMLDRHDPISITAYQALEAGIYQLRERGQISKAFRQSGFFNPQVDSWRTLGAPAAQSSDKH